MRYFLLALDGTSADMLAIQGRMPRLDDPPAEVTRHIEDAALSAGALARAVQGRMDDEHETAEAALEALTANYGRAEIEEEGHGALQALLDGLGITYDDMPDDEGDPS